MSNEQIVTVYTEWVHEGRRMDAVLAELIEEASRSYLQKLIEDGSVFLDGTPQRSKKEKLREGQRIDVVFPAPASLEILPQKMDLDIVYEDEDLLLVNKPKGLVVHPAAGNPDGTLVNGLLYHCKNLSVINGVRRPGIVHRIDKDTTGLLVVAKTDVAHRELSRQLAEHTMERQYVSVVWFGFNHEEGRIDAPLGRDPKNRLKRAVVPDGKTAVTHYKVKERLSSFTLIEAVLETGRTHQIRVHMAHVKHPLLGDVLYGPRKQPFGLTGQVLHAGVLGFTHPTKGREMRFQADPPAEFQNILEKLRR
ncbi:MAG: RluA family pseudouridine synthase [Bacillota bacterium]|jgi:23S rRNA pseudouridine1911/1915/1917 synthase|nr:RluA family pseudouridine synthase [Eubacteriales bacterium]MDI9491710.1 RluA family pseudouridine synthase [Bacillota bacterium]HPF18452.1 RluA family pseudouridine synthase [Bacillota bacterium]